MFKYFTDYKKVPSKLHRLQRGRLLSNVNVEEVFTFLSERILTKTTKPSELQKFKELDQILSSEISNVFRRFGPNSQTRMVYRTLRRRYLRARDCIISFNYDLVFEGSLRANSWVYGGIQPSKAAKLKIYKPHGSINFLRKGSQIEVSKSPIDRPLIVPPTHIKFVATKHGAGINEVWSQMERELSKVKSLVFIGYSFPPADLYFASVLRTVLASRDNAPGIVIVNPDAPAISERLKERFALTKVFPFFDLDSFIRSNRDDVLRALKV